MKETKRVRRAENMSMRDKKRRVRGCRNNTAHCNTANHVTTGELRDIESHYVTQCNKTQYSSFTHGMI